MTLNHTLHILTARTPIPPPTPTLTPPTPTTTTTTTAITQDMATTTMLTVLAPSTTDADLKKNAKMQESSLESSQVFCFAVSA